MKYLFILLPLLVACQQGATPSASYKLSAFSKDGVHAVVEIPAGTTLKIEYNPRSKRFEPDTLDESVRRINFLPYLGNYGFIPSTMMDEARGGDGDALDVLVLSESVPVGTVMQVLPIATLLLLDDGEIDTKIIAVPTDTTKRILQVDDFQDLFIHYDVAKRLVEEWFLNYKGANRTTLIGWQDEVYAIEEIKKWSVK